MNRQHTRACPWGGRTQAQRRGRAARRALPHAGCPARAGALPGEPGGQAARPGLLGAARPAPVAPKAPRLHRHVCARPRGGRHRCSSPDRHGRRLGEKRKEKRALTLLCASSSSECPPRRFSGLGRGSLSFLSDLDLLKDNKDPSCFHRMH